ncbi:hypothetical protein ACFL02_04420 [Planctomycetota bacterium]
MSKHARKKCPHTNFFYPYNLGLGPRAQLMLLLYEDITLNELYLGGYKKILRSHKKKINLLARELPGLLTLLLPGCSISGCSMRGRRGMAPALMGPMPQAIENLLLTNFPGETQENVSLKDIMIKPQARWDPDFLAKSQELWDTGYPLIYLSIPDEAKRKVEYLFNEKRFPEIISDALEVDWKFKQGYHTPKNSLPSEIKVLFNWAMQLGVLSNYPHSHRDYGNEWCCEPGVGCKWIGNPQSYCSLAENGNGRPQCSAHSIRCSCIENPPECE